jgi:hypothetical protein
LDLAEFEEDPSANTGRFRAFAQQADEPSRSAPSSRTALIAGAAVLAVIIIVLLVVTLK